MLFGYPLRALQLAAVLARRSPHRYTQPNAVAA